MNSVQCTVYSVQCTVYSVQSTYHTSLNVPRSPTSVQRPNSWTKSRQKSLEFSSSLFAVTSTYSFALRFIFLRTHATSYSFYRRKEENLTKKPYPLYVLRNPYRNLNSENSYDYAQKPQRTCTFMTSASVRNSHFSVAVIDSRTDRTAIWFAGFGFFDYQTDSGVIKT